jgi:hypothetical protein
LAKLMVWAVSSVMGGGRAGLGFAFGSPDWHGVA